MAKRKKVVAKSKAKETGRAPHLRVVAPIANEPPVVVPTNDADGAPLPAWRVARWHLVSAANLLLGEYRRNRGGSHARDFERAAAIARQLFASLEPVGGHNVDSLDRDRLVRMARISRFGLRTERSDAERWLLDYLPATATEARSAYWMAMGDAEGARNLARIALTTLAGQAHADAGKILRRWGAPDGQGILASTSFALDVDELASDIHELLDVHAEDFGRALVRCMYKRLGLGVPFAAEKKKAQRGKQER
jgi:hypothetical protein